MFTVEFPKLGWSIDINQVAFAIGDFKVYWYGIIIGTGFLLALLYALFALKRFGINKDSFFDCVLIGLITGIIGARLYYVLFRWDYYIQHLDEVLMIHNGGLAIYGGIIGGLLGGCITAKIKKISIPAILDVAVLGFLIGQGLGRWGNFFNQEAFGTPTDLPWGMLSENTNGVAVHPCFLYESLWCLLGFVLLHFFSKKFRKYDGQIFLLYLVWYGFERMIVEGLRTDSLYLPFGDIRVSQLLAALTCVIGIVLLIVFRKRTYKAVDTLSNDNKNTVSADIETVVKQEVSAVNDSEKIEETSETAPPPEE
ncbi:MAG: prolipoprotein diacylglyceryl transferase [Acutalibacteraceae bacterium]